jgi:hypothetical protein
MGYDGEEKYLGVLTMVEWWLYQTENQFIFMQLLYYRTNKSYPFWTVERHP